MRQEEYREFEKLIAAVQGKSFDEFFSMPQGFRLDSHYEAAEIDLKNIFGAVRAFYMTKFRVNEIKQGLDILERSLRQYDENTK